MCVTSGTSMSVVVSGSNYDMLQCDHDEADARLLSRKQNAFGKALLTRTVGRGVFVLLVCTFSGHVALYVAFGTG